MKFEKGKFYIKDYPDNVAMRDKQIIVWEKRKINLNNKRVEYYSSLFPPDTVILVLKSIDPASMSFLEFECDEYRVLIEGHIKFLLINRADYQYWSEIKI